MLAEKVLTPRELFENHWTLIESVIRWVSKRHCLRAEEAEDFASHAALKLVEDDYGVLRKFRGQSSLRTYLTTVITRIFLDYRIARWGKWRRSAAAAKAGPIGVRLDRLMFRDGYTMNEAVALVAGDPQVVMTHAELLSLAATLPSRSPRRQESEAALEELVAQESAEDNVALREAVRCTLSVRKALVRAFGELPGDDRLLLKMRFREDWSVARMASMLDCEAKGLYRRVHRALRALHSSMLASGVTQEEVATVLSWHGPWLPEVETSPVTPDSDGRG